MAQDTPAESAAPATAASTAAAAAETAQPPTPTPPPASAGASANPPPAPGAGAAAADGAAGEFFDPSFVQSLLGQVSRIFVFRSCGCRSVRSINIGRVKIGCVVSCEAFLEVPENAVTGLVSFRGWYVRAFEALFFV